VTASTTKPNSHKDIVQLKKLCLRKKIAKYDEMAREETNDDIYAMIQAAAASPGPFATRENVHMCSNPQIYS